MQGGNACRAKRHEKQKGRGVVIAAGGPIPLANAYVALHMLRNVHKCSLPVEIFFNGTQELDWSTRIFFTVHLFTRPALSLIE
jgi:hypothetical protein